MSERQLILLAQTLSNKTPEAEEFDLVTPREYHREWAWKNRIAPWDEERLWKIKSSER